MGTALLSNSAKTCIVKVGENTGQNCIRESDNDEKNVVQYIKYFYRDCFLLWTIKITNINSHNTN